MRDRLWEPSARPGMIVIKTSTRLIVPLINQKLSYLPCQYFPSLTEGSPPVYVVCPSVSYIYKWEGGGEVR